jgi:26S proteasome regulatory subunit T1
MRAIRTPLVCCRNYAQFSRTPAPAPPELARLLQDYAQQPPHPVRLSTLLAFASPLTSDSVLASAHYTLSELPKRLVQRVRAFESLPYLVGTNPFIYKILHGYRNSFQALAARTPVASLDENRTFIEELTLIVKSHSNDIATMAKGSVCRFVALD